MGYSTNPRLVVENEDLLEEILQQVVKKDSPLKIAGGDNVSSKQYQLRRILAATDRHPKALEGRYAGLGTLVTLRVRGTSIYIEKKIGASFTLSQPDEEDAIEKLKTYRGDLDVMEFKPSGSFNEAALTGRLLEEGWRLHPTTRIELDDGRVSYAVERITENSPKGFDILRQGG